MAAFAPLLFTGGTFGDVTRAIPLVVISVLLVSMLEAFCILPSHLSQNESFRKRFDLEARAVLTHHLVSTFHRPCRGR